jgi:hypothetical protein
MPPDCVLPPTGLNRLMSARFNAVARRVAQEPRRTILHNESEDGKRFLCQLGGNLRTAVQTRPLGRSQVFSGKTIRTKRRNEADPSDTERFV